MKLAVLVISELMKYFSQLVERFGTIKSQNQEILEQEFEEKLQSVQVQHQSQLSIKDINPLVW